MPEKDENISYLRSTVHVIAYHIIVFFSLARTSERNGGNFPSCEKFLMLPVVRLDEL